MFLVIWINFNSWIFNSKCHNSREISASGCWVKHWQFQFLVGSNDKYLEFKFRNLQLICVWGIFFKINLIIIFTNIFNFVASMHNTWFSFRFFLGQVLETKMLRRLQSKSKIIRYFYRKFLGFFRAIATAITRHPIAKFCFK